MNARLQAMDLPAASAASAACQVMRWDGGALQAGLETVVEETPVALVYNGISHAVLLASPQDLEEFALGFSLSEGILDHADQLFEVEAIMVEAGIELQMRIAGEAMHALKLRRRGMAGRTGCGLCGIESLQALARGTPRVDMGGTLRASVLHAAMAGLQDRQVLHQATGAVHAAGWAGWNGELHLVREDVGRHNALDKLIGAVIGRGIDPGSGFAVVTSRASYEMVQKVAQARMRLIAAISAPTAMAVRLAEESGVTLAGFVRPGRHVLYAHPERVLADEACFSDAGKVR
jgi:formate dehydrogenase accessory protein FdhD